MYIKPIHSNIDLFFQRFVRKNDSVSLERVQKPTEDQSFAKFEQKIVQTSGAYRDTVNEFKPFYAEFCETTFQNGYGSILPC